MSNECDFASGWMYDSINREIETVAGLQYRMDRQYTVVRHRWTDRHQDSQEGQTSRSITARNGGVDKEVFCPEVLCVNLWAERFTTSTKPNYVRNEASWIPTGFIANGYPMYAQYNERNIPDRTKVNVLFLWKDTDDDNHYWVCGEYTTQVFLQDLIEKEGADPDAITTNYVRTQSIGTSAIDIEDTDPTDLILGDTGSEEFGTFDGGAFIRRDTFHIPFTCESDNINYQTKGVSWYKQTQTWVAGLDT